MFGTLWRNARYFCGMPVRFRTRRQRAQFLSAAQDCRGSQQAVLASILEANRGSAFQEDFGLTPGMTAETFRRQVPIGDFEAHRPYVDRVVAGETGALLGAENRLLMFGKSSGTTGQPKLVPITDRFLNNYRRGWQIWGIGAFDAHPAMHRLNIVQLTSSHRESFTDKDVPCGHISGLVQEMQSPVVRTMYSVPQSLVAVEDCDARDYLTLLTTLANPHVGMVSTANPSTLLRLARHADAWSESLIRDLHDGTISQEEAIPNAVRTSLTRQTIRPRPSVARRLEEAKQRRGRLTPKDYWPHLQLIAVWTGGSCALYLDELRDWYGATPVRDHGLHATEGRMTIPVDNGTPSGILDITSHYFEFIPVSEAESQSPVTLEAHELTEGEDYLILLTTVAGLARYDIHDVVRCTGFYGSTPLLEFINKGAHVSSLTGEKLTESQIVNALIQAMADCPIRISRFTVAPVWGTPPHYILLTDELIVDDAAARLAREVDSALMEANCEYGEKRNSNRLDPLTVRRLLSGTLEDLFEQSSASRVDQLKLPRLVPDIEFAKQVDAG